MKKYELSPSELKLSCPSGFFKFDTTEELDSFNGIIGQERALEALNTGVSINVKGYNMFLVGASGIGKTAYALEVVNKMAKKKKIPNDWCYVYNFDNPNEPIAIDLPAGSGAVFKEDLDLFIKNILKEIPRAFNNENYTSEKNTIMKNFEEKKKALMNLLDETAAKQNFKIYNTDGSIYFMPILHGKAIDEEDYTKLDDKLKKDIEIKSNILQSETLEIMKRIKDVEQSANTKVAQWEDNIAIFAVGFQINDLKTKYKRNKNIVKLLENIQRDILKNISYFCNQKDVCDNTNAQAQINTFKPWDNYRVNLFVDNSHLTSAPVITDLNPTFNGLFGKLEYEKSYGSLKTDHTMIINGLIHKANGGFLILQAKDLMTNTILWETFKRSIRNRSIQIDVTRDTSQNISITSLKPLEIPLDIKVLLIGTEALYNNLSSVDPDFKKLFKIKVDFDTCFDKSDDNIKKISMFISGFCRHEDLPHFTNAAVSKMVEYSSRLAGNQLKLSAQFNDFGEIISEAATIAILRKSKCVCDIDVEQAIKNNSYRNGKVDNNIFELIKDGSMLISTSGSKIGQINGLTVINTLDETFGKPVRITANTFVGKSGVVNIEREVALSGSSHSKGILILSSYLGENFAQDMPLALTASICFEQLYGGVDGDSASSTELYAILSSLSNVPINQALAVTGSVNQKGEVQVIGGVTEKIEGFFKICKSNGLNKENGVIIPFKNVQNLNLSEEIIDAVKSGLFHIYAIKTIDEGIELLTGVPAGKLDAKGTYPPGSINYLVYEKLKKYAKISASYN